MTGMVKKELKDLKALAQLFSLQITDIDLFGSYIKVQGENGRIVTISLKHNKFYSDGPIKEVPLIKDQDEDNVFVVDI